MLFRSEELRKSFQIDGEDEATEDDEDDDFVYEEEEVAEEYGSDFYGDDE